MMGLFKKKLSDEELIKQNIAAQQAELAATDDANKKEGDEFGDSKLGIEVTKIKAQLEGVGEQRKATSERFSRISEEIGEIRGMVMETNKAVSKIEASSTRAIDLVESVKPEELMIEVRKQDTKIESLKASLESYESLLRDIMKEMKEMRKRMDFYKGVEQVAKMNEEIKQELIDIKKTESVLDRHSNKIESIYLDVEKKFTEFDKYGDVAKELTRNFAKLQGDVDKLRVKVEDKSDKQELLKYITKFNEFEKHTTNIINLMDERSKSSSDNVQQALNSLKMHVNAKVNDAIKQLNAESERAAKAGEKHAGIIDLLEEPQPQNAPPPKDQPQVSVKGIIDKLKAIGQRPDEQSQKHTQ